MGGFLGDIAKPLNKFVMPLAPNFMPRPQTSSERGAEKQRMLVAQEKQKRQTLAAEERRLDSERQYRAPENVRQRATVAQQESGLSGKRSKASDYLGY